MKRGRILLLGCLALVVIGAIYGAALIRRGFAASEEPSGLEKLMARAVRNLSIPGRARKETNPWKPTPENRSEEHTSELQSHSDLVCRLLLEKKKTTTVSSTSVSTPSVAPRTLPQG